MPPRHRAASLTPLGPAFLLFRPSCINILRCASENCSAEGFVGRPRPAGPFATQSCLWNCLLVGLCMSALSVLQFRLSRLPRPFKTLTLTSRSCCMPRFSTGSGTASGRCRHLTYYVPSVFKAWSTAGRAGPWKSPINPGLKGPSFPLTSFACT